MTPCTFICDGGGRVKTDAATCKSLICRGQVHYGSTALAGKSPSLSMNSVGDTTRGSAIIMALDLIPKALRDRYRFEEREHACSILAGDFASEWKDLLDCLKAFVLKRSYVTKGGGGRSDIPQTLDGFLRNRGWAKKRFDIQVMVDGQPYPTPTHEIDNFKNRVGVEVEWNNKTEFYDRDLNNFRLLHQLHVVSVGIIITRVSELQDIFDKLGIGKKYGPSTTHWSKLIPKVNGGGAGGCPLLLVGLGVECYDCHS